MPAGIYYVRVRAVGLDGESLPSNEVAVMVGAATPCASPPNQPLLGTPAVTGNRVTLTWSPAAAGCAATSFTLQAGSSPGLSNIAMVNAAGAQTFSASAANGVYYLRVVAQNPFGTSAPSNEMSAIVGVAPPTVPVPLTFAGTIGPSDPPCATMLGPLPCRVISFRPNESGIIDARLHWGSRAADLDFYVYKGDTRLASAFASSGNDERVLQAVEAGETYEMRLAYLVGTEPQSYTLTIAQPVPAAAGTWNMAGTGNAVITLPANVRQIRVAGAWNRTDDSTFVVRIGGQVVVNEILFDAVIYDSVHAVAGTVVEVVNSPNVTWFMIQVP